MSILVAILTRFFSFQAFFERKMRLRGAVTSLRQVYWRVRLRKMGQGTVISRNVVIEQSECVSIGDECNISEFVHIWGGGGVTIGDNVLIASHVRLVTITHDVTAEIFGRTLLKKPIVINDNVWIGSGAVILPGVCLSKGCIVGAGAVVTRDVDQNIIVCGVPARPLRNRFTPLK